MRTKLQGMDDGEPGRDGWDAAIEQTESYETDADELVIYDGKNPLAWIKSSFFGLPIDILEPVERDDEEAAGEEQGGT